MPPKKQNGNGNGKSRKNKNRNRGPNTIVGQPLSRAQSNRTPFMNLSGSQGKLRVSHSENVMTVRSPGAGATFKATSPVFPLIFGVGGRLAQVHQTVRIISWQARYKPTVGADTEGKVTLAPWYNNSLPALTNGLNAAVDITNGIDWLDATGGAVSMPPGGAPELLGNICRFFVERFARKLFHTYTWENAGSVSRSNFQASNGSPEDVIPGHLIVMCTSDVTAGANLGDVWIDYELEFENPAAGTFRSFTLNRTTTTDAALALETVYSDGTIAGTGGWFGLSGNTIVFQCNGVFDILVHYVGSTPVVAASTLSDNAANNVLDARLAGYWDVSSAAVTDITTTTGAGNILAASATVSTSYHRVFVSTGDAFTLAALASGTMTSVRIVVNETSRALMIAA